MICAGEVKNMFEKVDKGLMRKMDGSKVKMKQAAEEKRWSGVNNGERNVAMKPKKVSVKRVQKRERKGV